MNSNKTLSISIMSGKGGVDKTNISLSLGYALHAEGKGVLLLDCDLGLANLDVLLGLSPDKNLQDLLRPEVNSGDVVVNIEPGGLDFLPAASGVPELVEMDEDMQDLLFKKLVQLIGGYDFLILDLGAGINKTVLSFAAMTQIRVVVVTPEPTSLTDSYALMKVLHQHHDIDDFLVLVNQATPAEAKQTFERLSAACKKFLGITIRSLGSVRSDKSVLEAVRRQTPLMKYAPDSEAAKDVSGLAAKLERFRSDNQKLIAATPPLKNFPELGAPGA
ncbi:Cobyrinic acid ac-diamide synthase [Desulfovibrio sp. X2]|uniref:MinD/ParA family protein n=1 Tax=Desulfovibrio sp. X2 TaxID=941449 RepID=UPI000358C420|nr:MinD/ParA family protein [Desulfovibrio sp. X2]EPR42355.1 Cobyrinic acid ac-diamide synthase [Desulfovibrio sp. X2]